MGKDSEKIRYIEIEMNEQNPPGFPYTYYATDLWILNDDRTHGKEVFIITDNWNYRGMDDSVGLRTMPYSKFACAQNLMPHFTTYRGGIRGMEFKDFEKIATLVEKTPELMSEKQSLDSFKILSVEECEDKDYGESLVQYSLGDGHVSFAFCNVDVTCKDFNINQIKEDIMNQPDKIVSGPLWSDLSEVLRDEILESNFDMHFIEHDDEDWSEEKADKVWEEVKNFNFNSTITRGEDDNFLTFYAGAMGDVNWSGHPYYGEPCLEEIIVSQDKIRELKEQENTFVYVDSHGDLNYVQFHVGMYHDNDNLCLEMVAYEPELDAMDHFGFVTVNTEANFPYLHSLIDTNNNGANLIPFLLENGFGELTGEYIKSGFCKFPVFKFSEEKLKEVCPKEFSEYQKAYGKAMSLDSRISKCVKEQGENGPFNKKQLEKGSERE